MRDRQRTRVGRRAASAAFLWVTVAFLLYLWQFRDLAGPLARLFGW